MKIGAFFTIAALGIAGCATSPIPVNQAQSVPADRVFLQEQLPREGNSFAVFVRDVGFLGSGVYYHLFIDGKKAASMNPGERVEFVLTPGEHIFGVIPTDPFGAHAFNTIDQDLKPNRQYFYRVLSDGNSGRTAVQRFTPQVE